MCTSGMPGRRPRAACRLIALSWGVVLVAAGQGVAQCEPRWSHEFASEGINARSFAGGVFDEDGPGPGRPALFVSGEFTNVGGTPARYIAKWDGEAWGAVGSGLNGTASCFFEFDPDGPGSAEPVLVVGGTFTMAGGAPANNIATWNGERWSAMGAGLNFTVHQVVVFDDDGAGPHAPALLAAGRFTMSGSRTVNRVARWTGAEWVALGSGFDDDVDAMIVFDEDGAGPGLAYVVFSGLFATAGGASAPRVARWNGTSFSGVGAALPNNEVRALCSFDPDGNGPQRPQLIAGGDSQGPSGEVPCIVRWDGATWQEVPDGLRGTVLALHAPPDPAGGGDMLFAGGLIGNNTQPYGSSVCRFDGSRWVAVGPPGANGGVYEFDEFDADAEGPDPARMLIIGDFTIAGGVNCPRVAAWDGATFHPVGPSRNAGLNDSVAAMEVFDVDGDGPQPASLFLGGRFTTAGDRSIRRIGRWDGHRFFEAGQASNNVTGMGVFDPDGDGPAGSSLYVSGFFGTIGGIQTPGMARFDADGWHAGEPGSSGAAQAFAAFDSDGDGPGQPVLYAGGTFSSGGWHFLRRLVNGRWEGFAGGPDRDVYDLITFDFDGEGPDAAELVACGSFSRVGNENARGIARFNGQRWTGVGLGLDGNVNALAVLDEDGAGPNPARLFAGGWFTRSGNTTLRGVARWNGTAWEAVGSLQDYLSVNDIAAIDEDGAGPMDPSLIVVGSFSGSISPFFGPRYRGILRWDGSAWSTLDEGLNVIPLRVLEFDADGDGPETASIMVGGRNTLAGSGATSSQFIASYGTRPGIGFLGHPVATQVNRCAEASFAIDASSPGSATFRWERDGVALADGKSPGGSIISGATTRELTIQNAQQGDAGEYRCFVVNECGETPSDRALLRVCVADYDCNGATNSSDFFAFLDDFFEGRAAADVNADALVNSQDFFDFLGDFFGGC